MRLYICTDPIISVKLRLSTTVIHPSSTRPSPLPSYGMTETTSFIIHSVPIPCSSRTRATQRRLRPPKWTCCADSSPIPNSPGLLVRSWADSRRLASTLDLSRHFVSILFLSNNCQRAAFAEKQLTELAQTYSISRRLLILSAGIHSTPGSLLPWKVVSAAEQRSIDLSEDQPCAAFNIADLDYYDFVVVVDRNTKEKVTRMAEAHAHTSGGHLYEWERKIRLLCDFDGSLVQRQRSAGNPLDVPPFTSSTNIQTAMDVIESGCEAMVKSLLAAGL